MIFRFNFEKMYRYARVLNLSFIFSIKEKRTLAFRIPGGTEKPKKNSIFCHHNSEYIFRFFRILVFKNKLIDLVDNTGFFFLFILVSLRYI